MAHEHLITIGIINGPRQRSAIQTTGDRHRVVWNSVKQVHRSVDRIHHPLVLPMLRTLTALLSQKSVIRENPKNLLPDLLLNPSVQLQLDVMLLRQIHLQGLVPCLAQKISRVPGHPFGSRAQRLGRVFHSPVRQWPGQKAGFRPRGSVSPTSCGKRPARRRSPRKADPPPTWFSCCG